MTAADLLIHDLRESGIACMATLCGHGLDPLFQAARNAGTAAPRQLLHAQDRFLNLLSFLAQ
jgi:hypothetical protein